MRIVNLSSYQRDPSFLYTDVWNNGGVLIDKLPSKNCKLKLHSIQIFIAKTNIKNEFTGFPLHCILRINQQEYVYMLQHNSIFGAVYQMVNSTLLRITTHTHMLAFQFKFTDCLVPPASYSACWNPTNGIQMVWPNYLSSSNGTVVDSGVLTHAKQPLFHVILVGRRPSTIPTTNVVYFTHHTVPTAYSITYENEVIARFLTNNTHFFTEQNVQSVSLTNGANTPYAIMKLNGLSETAYTFGTNVRDCYNEIGIDNALYDANQSYFDNAQRFIRSELSGQTWSIVFSNLYTIADDIRFIRYAFLRDHTSREDKFDNCSIVVTYVDGMMAYGHAALTPEYVDNTLIFFELDLHGFANNQQYSYAHVTTRILSVQITFHHRLAGTSNVLQIGPVLLFNSSGKVSKMHNAVDMNMRFQIGE